MNDVIKFWFEVLNPADWFRSSPDLDARVTERFAATHKAVAAGEMFSWRTSAEGRLAEIIVLDQFSRMMFRDTRNAFAFDGMALVLAQEAVAAGSDQQVPVAWRSFVYMPYMHSESLVVHVEALRLFATIGGDALKYEHLHADVLRRFGRYPRRNAALERVSTPEEIAYMAQSSAPV